MSNEAHDKAKIQKVTTTKTQLNGLIYQIDISIKTNNMLDNFSKPNKRKQR